MSMNSLIVLLVIVAPLRATVGQMSRVSSTLLFEYVEPLDLGLVVEAHTEYDIFDGMVHLRVPFAEDGTPRGAIKIEIETSLNGDLVVPRTGFTVIGFLFDQSVTQGGTFLFDEDVYRIGGYFENNSPADDAVLEFFDRNGFLIQSETVDIPKDGGTWVWHGWRSTVAIRSMTIRGLSEPPFNGGFIWFDDLKMTTYENCSASTDGDADVDIVDFLNVLNSWGVTCGGPCGPDANDDYTIGIEDFLMVLANWGPCS